MQSENVKKTTGSRSTNGCWTCRLRRKKCDETRPSCETCGNIGVTCDGFGVRPAWMDRGPLERKKADTVRLEMAQNGHKRRRRSRRDTVIQADADSTQGPSIASTSPMEERTTPCLSSQPGEQLDLVFSGVELVDDRDFGNITHSPDDLAANLMVWQGSESREAGELARIQADDFKFDSFHFPDPLQTTQGYELEGLELSLTNHESKQSHHNLVVPPAEQSNNSLGTTTASSVDSMTSLLGGAFETSAFPSAGRRSELSKGNAMLLSYYIDRVIAIQFPFSRVSRQWLYFLLLSSESVLEISLALSQAYFNSEMGEKDTISSEPNLLRAIAALKAIPSPSATLSLLDDDQRISQVIIASTCLVQTIYLEIFHGGTRHWEHCLKQAGPYMQSLIDIAVSATNNQGDHMSNYVTRAQPAAAKALLSQLVWLDVIATLSTGKGPLLGVNHGYLLESDIVNIEQVCGCQNKAIKMLCDILDLQHWKFQAERENRLNVIELATRGMSILENLDFLISQLDDEQSTQNTTNEPNQREPRRTKDVTLLFAHSAILYLHIVISGPNPRLPEIRKEVTELIGCFKALDGDMTRYVSWPLCVTVCFAGKEEKQILLNLDLGQRNVPRHFLRSSEAIKIAEECERLRRDEGKNCDWMLAMRNQHNYVLLS